MRRSIVVAVLALALGGCATAPVASNCLLGHPNGRQILAQGAWGDPVDALITRSLEEEHGWQCPSTGSPGTTVGALR